MTVEVAGGHHIKPEFEVWAVTSRPGAHLLSIFDGGLPSSPFHLYWRVETSLTPCLRWEASLLARRYDFVGVSPEVSTPTGT